MDLPEVQSSAAGLKPRQIILQVKLSKEIMKNNQN